MARSMSWAHPSRRDTRLHRVLASHRPQPGERRRTTRTAKAPSDETRPNLLGELVQKQRDALGLLEAVLPASLWGLYAEDEAAAPQNTSRDESRPS